MKVILLENLKKVGSIGEIIEVKRGGKYFLMHGIIKVITRYN